MSESIRSILRQNLLEVSASIEAQLKAKTKEYMTKNFLNLEIQDAKRHGGSKFDVKWEDAKDKDGPLLRYILRVDGKIFSVAEKHIIISAPTGIR